MNYFKAEWGTFNYINKKRILEIVKTVIMFAIALIIYFAALFILKTNKNIFTVIAVLTVLPAAKCAVSMIMFLKFKSLNSEEFRLINDNVERDIVLYEMIFTTNQSSYLVKSCAVTQNTIIMYAAYDDKQLKTLTAHIKTCLERDYIKGYSVKIFSNINDFTKRLKEMNINLSEETDSIVPVKNLFRSITL